MSEVLDIYNRAPNGGELLKAMNTGDDNPKVEPKSAIIDPLNTTMLGGTRQKPTAIPYVVLRRMSEIPAISAIINTRLNQVARYAKRPRFNGDIGFRIGLKNNREQKMTDAQKKRASEIEDFFLRTGWEKNKVRKDNFNTFLRKITRDSLTLDVMTFEKVGTLKGELAEIWAVDGATVELVINNPTGEGNDYNMPVYKPDTRSGLNHIGDLAYVQKINGVTVAEFTEDDLAFAIRNPRTDIRYTDFGMSELETLIEIVTGIVNGVRYNTSYFSSSNLPQGVMEIVGKYQDKHLEAFKRQWKNLTQGAPGKWSVPVMALEDGQGFKFTPFKNSNKDMEFNEFLEFLFNIACAVYQIDPNEVGFKSWTSSTGAMGQSDNTQTKVDESKDKGFIPLMTFLSDTFNSEVVDLIDEELCFEWVGLDEEDEDRKMERIKARLDAGLSTVREERKTEDLDEILGEDGKPALWTMAPANPQLIQVFMSEMQAKQQAQMGEQGEQQGQQQAEAEQQQSEESRKQQLEDSETAHNRQLEVMDVAHKQGMEAKEHEHNLQMEQAKAMQKDDKPKGKDEVKKSIENDFAQFGVAIDWADY